MLGSFLVRSLERSERVYQAMLSRGYSGGAVALGEESAASPSEVCAGAIAAFFFVTLRAWAEL